MNYSKILCLSLFALLAFFVISVLSGSVDVTLRDLYDYFFNNDKLPDLKNVILFSRLNTALVAIVSGAALSVAGLLLQTLFANPLADSSVLGISSGANLGVAFCLMFFGAASAMSFGLSHQLMIALSSFLGALPIILLLLFVSKSIHNKLVVLIVGLMFSFISSALVSVVEFFSMKESLYSYVLWGMGSFSSVPKVMILPYIVIVTSLLFCSFFMVKPLNTMLLGDVYASNLGINVKRVRTVLILLSSMLVAMVTAYCGPIGFIGLAVPHIVRFALKKSDHKIVLPFCIVWGGLFALICLLISRLPGLDGALPVNVITSIIGAPILIWILFQPSVKNMQ